MVGFQATSYTTVIPLSPWYSLSWIAKCPWLWSTREHWCSQKQPVALNTIYTTLPIPDISFSFVIHQGTSFSVTVSISLSICSKQEVNISSSNLCVIRYLGNTTSETPITNHIIQTQLASFFNIGRGDKLLIKLWLFLFLICTLKLIVLYN